MPRTPLCPDCSNPTRRVYTRAPRIMGSTFVAIGWECLADRRLFYDDDPRLGGPVDHNDESAVPTPPGTHD